MKAPPMVVLFGAGGSVRSICSRGRPVCVRTITIVYRIHPGGYQLDPADGDFTENQMASTQRAGETGRGHETGFPLLGWLEGDLVRR